MVHLYWLARNKGHGIRELQQTRIGCSHAMCGKTDLPASQIVCFADDADCVRCLELFNKEATS